MRSEKASPASEFNLKSEPESQPHFRYPSESAHSKRPGDLLRWNEMIAIP